MMHMPAKSYMYLMLMVMALLWSSCSKENNETYLIFGSQYGLCAGEHCLDVFKLTETSLYEDKEDMFLGGSYIWTELPSQKYQQARALLSNVPSQLREGADGTFGCPDCYDQGAIIVHYFDGETLHEYLIDTEKKSIPASLHTFVDEVKTTIELIR